MAEIDVATLNAQRWFGGKGAPIVSVRTVDQARLPSGGTLAFIEVSYGEGRAAERYLVADSIDEQANAIALLDLMRGEARIRTASGELRGEQFGAGFVALAARPATRRLSAEQTNTSLVFDDRVIVKLIRKAEQGVNPELEVGAFLARRGFSATPQLLGGVSIHGLVEATVAVAHRFVKVETDGWNYALGRLREGGSLLPEVGDLGLRVGQLHAALASDAKDSAFAPEPITAEDLRRWSRAILDELARTVKSCAAAVPGLEACRPSLEARIRRLEELPASGVRIRLHGDLHLGQVMRSEGEWLIFDFEGEPARSLAERKAKHCPLRDVAGMLRSFAYAAAVAKIEPARLQPARDAFMQGYLSAAGRLLPQDQRASEALLDALLLEKLLYELRYEVGHRPDWVEIPARDLLAEAQR